MTAYAIPEGSMGFWEKRFEKFQMPFNKTERFGEEYLEFFDPHGLRLELVERGEGGRNEWSFGGVTPDAAIKGFAGAVLFSAKPEQTADLLQNRLGLELAGREGDLIRFRSPADIGNIIDLKAEPSGRGRIGVGTVHHIAWRAEDDEDQLEWQKLLSARGYGVTPVQDRNYFNSVYFREEGEILFEIATDPPGFTLDEPEETMGEKLMLPAQYERYREKLDRTLPPISVREMA